MEIIKKLNSILAVSNEEIRASGEKRKAMVDEAISWPSGSSQEKKRYHEIWSGKSYKIKLGKPGKEAAPGYDRCRYRDGHRGNNPNDMVPIIWGSKGPLAKDRSGSFTDIFDELQSLSRANENALELIACLLFRSAFVVDHIEIGSGHWRYDPPKEILLILKKYTPIALGVPIEVFLHYLDALAWNEDVKYYTLGYDITGQTGRQNNLLTCVNLMAVFLDRVSMAKFAGNFARPPVGISAISRKRAFEVFPLLRSDATNND